MIKTEDRIYSSIEDLCIDVMVEFGCLLKTIDYPYLTIVSSNIEEVKEIIYELSLTYNIYETNFKDNADVYYIDIDVEGVTVTPAINNNNEYVYTDCDLAFISNDANSKILQFIESTSSYAYEINE